MGTEWEILDEQRPLLTAIYGDRHVRMAAVGLGDGTLCVVTPGPGVSEETFAALERFGRPRFLLAPNHYHNMGIPSWKARFPDATVIARPDAHARLRKRCPGIPIEGLEGLSSPHIRVFGPPMATQGETWLSMDTAAGRAWFVTDGIINETNLGGGPVSWFLRAAGFRTELMINPFFKRLFVKPKAAYLDWLRDELDRDPPALFIPCHGAILRGPDLVPRLLAAVDAA